MQETRISDNAAQSRFELQLGDSVAAFAEYEIEDKTMTLTHTEVLPGHEGGGIGSKLAKFALDDARGRGLKVLPLCSFMKTWIERHPDYADLVAPD